MLQVAIWMQCKNWRRRRDKEVRDIMNPISSTTSRHIKWSTCDLRCWSPKLSPGAPHFAWWKVCLACPQKIDRSILRHLVFCHISLCPRPRLWWFDWEVTKKEGYSTYLPETSHSSDYGAIIKPHRSPAIRCACKTILALKSRDFSWFFVLKAQFGPKFLEQHFPLRKSNSQWSFGTRRMHWKERHPQIGKILLLSKGHAGSLRCEESQTTFSAWPFWWSLQMM